MAEQKAAQKLPWLFNSYAFMCFSVAFADLASFMAKP